MRERNKMFEDELRRRHLKMFVAALASALIGSWIVITIFCWLFL